MFVGDIQQKVCVDLKQKLMSQLHYNHITFVSI